MMVWLRVLPLRVAATALRKKAPAQIVVAVPIASSSTCSELEAEVDRVVCAVTPEPFWAVGQWYRNFFHTTDEEVRRAVAPRLRVSSRKSSLGVPLWLRINYSFERSEKTRTRSIVRKPTTIS